MEELEDELVDNNNYLKSVEGEVRYIFYISRNNKSITLNTFT